MNSKTQNRRFKWNDVNPDANNSHLYVEEGIVRGITVMHMRNKSQIPRDPHKFSKPVTSNKQRGRMFKWYEYNNGSNISAECVNTDNSHLYVEDGIIRGITIPYMRNKSQIPRDPHKFSKPDRKT